MSLFPRVQKFESNIAAGWNPVKEMRNLQRELDHFFNLPLSQGDLGLQSFQAFAPSCDFEETDSNYVFTFDIPGMKKENISIEVDNNNVLTVCGERNDSSKEKNASNYKKERFYGAFERSFTLPLSVKTDQIEAQYSDGVLKVIAPKSEPTKVTQIKIGEVKSAVQEKKH